MRQIRRYLEVDRGNLISEKYYIHSPLEWCPYSLPHPPEAPVSQGVSKVLRNIFIRVAGCMVGNVWIGLGRGRIVVCS